MKNVLLATCLMLAASMQAAEPNLKIALPGMNGFAVGDLNGDGLPDIAVSSPNGVSLFFQRKDRTFKKIPDRLLPVKNAFDVIINDFDGDGKNDVACANYHPNLYVFFNRDHFTMPLTDDAIDQWAPRLACGQLSPGKHVDVLAGWVWRRILPNGTLYEAVFVPAKGGDSDKQDDPVIRDLDCDGTQDVVFSSNKGFNIYYGPLEIPLESYSFIRPEALSMFISIPFPMATSSSYVVADADGDGNPDIVYSASHLNDGINYFPQDRFTGFRDVSAKTLLPGIQGFLLYDDFDKTGRKKLAVLSQATIEIYNLPSKTRESVSKTDIRDEIIRVKSGDVNGDGKAEFLVGTKNGLMMFNSSSSNPPARSQPMK